MTHYRVFLGAPSISDLKKDPAATYTWKTVEPPSAAATQALILLAHVYLVTLLWRSNDDILGDLARPNQFTRATPSPQAPPLQCLSSRPVSPPPHIVGQIMEMGFSPQQARIARAATDTGLDVQAALETLFANGAGNSSTPPCRVTTKFGRPHVQMWVLVQRRPMGCRWNVTVDERKENSSCSPNICAFHSEAADWTRMGGLPKPRGHEIEPDCLVNYGRWPGQRQSKTDTDKGLLQRDVPTVIVPATVSDGVLRILRVGTASATLGDSLLTTLPKLLLRLRHIYELPLHHQFY
ncbi:hypothetical protein P692DRAFT_20908528 [Suillus brevipes Sb2]|nr:hypothetical protein P692DRAFT_20908528 [Suillus brevipes Sb2]